MIARTVSARDLETMAHAAHERVELPGPEGGWATAVINGHHYRARVAPAAVALANICAAGGDHESVYMTEDDGRIHWRCLRCGVITEETP